MRKDNIVLVVVTAVAVVHFRQKSDTAALRVHIDEALYYDITS